MPARPLVERAALLGAAAALGAGPWAADTWRCRPPAGAAFARRARGFGAAPTPTRRRPQAAQEAEVLVEDAGVPAPLEGAKLLPSAASSVGSSELQVIVAGGGAAGLWLALLLASRLQSRTRVRVYEPQWERADDGALQWSAAAREGAHRHQVTTVPGYVWSQLPGGVQERVFPPGQFAEQWPRGRADRDAGAEGGPFPRNVPLGELEDGLLAAAQQPEFADGLELWAAAYDEAVHLAAGADDPYHVLVAADGEAALRVSDGIAHGGAFGRLLPRPGSQGLADTLALAFSLGHGDAEDDAAAPLSVSASTAVSLSQRRYLVSWTGETRGTLHMRLTVDEAREFADTAPECHEGASGLSWLRDGPGKVRERALEGLRLYGIPVRAVRAVTRHSSDGVVRPSFCAPLPGLRSPTGATPVAFLVGDAALTSMAHFGPGFGPGAALEGVTSLAQALADEAQGSWWLGQWLAPSVLADHAAKMACLRDRERQPTSVGIEQCIDAGLARAARAEGNADAGGDCGTFLENLRSALGRLGPEQLPEGRAAELPTWEALRSHVLACDLQAETLSVFASTGPWSVESVDVVEQVTPDLGPDSGVFNFGGETAEGVARAAHLTKAGQAGDTDAQFQLGVMYFTADGMEQDGAAALEWLTRAAEGGHLQAQNCVGSILRNGLGGQIANKPQAARWFELAAGRGEVEAQYNLGEMYDEADGIRHDEAEAFKWFQRAADGGLAQAQYKLGIMLHTGSGVDKDVVRSVSFITQAAEQGLPVALHMLGSLHYAGDGVALDKVAASRYFTKAAEAGDALAQYSLGVMLELGDGVERDLEASQRWLRQAAAQGVLEAQARLGDGNLLPQLRA